MTLLVSYYTYNEQLCKLELQSEQLSNVITISIENDSYCIFYMLDGFYQKLKYTIAETRLQIVY